ncbi:MAG TPA: TRAP transporter small permease [Syntrophomonadaceae bacterium]|nr:TRAP transporter small permease [Syntrophomonadaceae bacterium]
MVDRIRRINDAITSAEYFVTVTLFAIMLILMLIQVIFRYFLEIPLGWSEEAARYLYISTTFLGAAIAVKERDHIEINFITVLFNKFADQPQFREKLIKIGNLVRDGLAIIFLSIVSYHTWFFALDQYLYNIRSTAMFFPMYILSGTVLLSCLLMVLHYIFTIYLNLNNTGITGYEPVEEDA